tara:strand:+ start:212 stop:796 length:585 start_codon:yes stop_codon:yes gene_type:complete
MKKTIKEKRKYNREAQRKYASSEKGKIAIREKIRKWRKKKYKENPNYFDKWKQDRSKYFEDYHKNIRKKDPIKLKETQKKNAKSFYQKTKNTPKYIILRRLRNRLVQVMMKISKNKITSTKDLLGCSIDDFKEHIEQKFSKGMNWENHGEWHLDHIKPISKFNLEDKNERKKCFHYSNLQPLWAIKNLTKSNKY